MPFQGEVLRLRSRHRVDLEEIARLLLLPAGFVLRAKIVLLLAGGFSCQSAAGKLDASTPAAGKWKKRFLPQGLDGLETHRPGQPPCKLTARLRAKILNATRRRLAAGSTHWSCCKLAQTLGISKDLVHRLWREAGLQPHRLECYPASHDPGFERKAAGVIGLYLDPPRPSCRVPSADMPRISPEPSIGSVKTL